MSKFKIILIICVFICSNLMPQKAFSALPNTTVEGSPYSFEDSIPKSWSAYQGGSTTLSNSHFKLGSKSLKWNFTSGSALRITNPIGLPTAPGMVFWIYNEKPSTTSVKFNLWRNGLISKSFNYDINFKGWRCFWYVFNEYGFANLKGPDMVELKSNGTGSGSLFFDAVEFSTLATAWRVGDIHIGYMPTAYDLVKPYTNPRPIATQLPTDEELTGIQTIAKRCQEVFMGSGKYATNTYMQSKKARVKAIADWELNPSGSFNKYAISAQPDGTQRGIGLFSLNVPYKPTFSSDASPTLASLALDYKVNNAVAHREKCLQLLDYMYDQGWAGGSGLGINVADLLRLTPYFISVVLLQDDIKALGPDRMNREAKTLDWWSIYGNIFKANLPLGGENSDALRNVTPGKLAYVLLEPDPVKQLQAMKAFKSFLELNLAEHSGSGDFIKPDGSAYHHGFAYNMGYCPNALYAAAYFIYMLHDTPFAVSESIFNGVRKALITMYNQSYFYTAPESTHGRFFGQGGLLPIPPALAWMALSKPDDLELMSIAKRMCNFSNSEFTNYTANSLHSVQNSVGALEACLAVKENTKVSAAKEPQLTTYLPFSGLFISRHKGWLLTIKGCSKYLNDFEGGLNENTYGRFGGWGYQEISNETLGYKSYTTPSKSWDWTRFPGTTARRLTLESLRYDAGKDKPTRRPFDEVFLGGVNVNDSVGMFAFKFHDCCKDSTSRFRKSTFAFANVFLNLGTDIVNRDTSCDAETTLFQDLQSPKLDVPTVLSIPVTSPVSIDLGTIKNKVLIRNGGGVNYIVYPYGGGVLNVMRQSQTNNDHTGAPMTSANYDVAVINHGKAPVNKSYRYMTLLGIPSEKVQSVYMGDNSPIEIRQQDRNAHVVYHRELKTYGYAVFESNLQFSTGILKSSLRPVIMMVEYLDNNLVKVIISDPDLNRDITNSEALTQPIDINVSLRGNYELVSGSERAACCTDGQTSTITDITIDGKANVYILRDKNTTSINTLKTYDFQVFPNPIKDKLYYKTDINCSFDLRLYDQVGKLVLQKKEINSISGEISLSGIQSGHYVLKVSFQNGFTKVFIIKK